MGRKCDIHLVDQDGRTVRACEIAPGLFVSRDVLAEPGEEMFGVVEWRRDEGGNGWFPVVVGWERALRVTRGNFKSLGLGIDYDCFYKLCRAGYIRTRRMSPDTLEIFPSSLAEHMRRVEDQKFWTRERVEHYNTAIFETLREPSRLTPDERAERRRRRKAARKQERRRKGDGGGKRRRRMDAEQLDFGF